MTHNLPALLTPQQVAEWLAWPTGRVVKMARKGEIPCVKLPGDEVMFDRAELLRWLESLQTVKEGCER
jgi:excisionase family DNA binding protein